LMLDAHHLLCKILQGCQDRKEPVNQSYKASVAWQMLQRRLAGTPD
jgi:hypothetical protein